MESLDFTTDELRAERTRALKLAALCRAHGVPQAATTYDLTVAAIEAELAERGE
jgi:hypothetical protein